MQAGGQQGYDWIISRLTATIEQALGIVRCFAFPSLTQLALRLALAVPFWKSGILKWDGFLLLNGTAITLFTDEFKLHLPGGPYDFPAPAVMAFLSGCGEIAFPVLLVLGFGTRFAATGLLFITFIVELTVPDGCLAARGTLKSRLGWYGGRTGRERHCSNPLCGELQRPIAKAQRLPYRQKSIELVRIRPCSEFA